MKRKLSAFLVVLCIIFGLSAFTACSNLKDKFITKNEFTVTFNSNGGSEISPFKGTVLETLPTPTKAGFVFDGWYSTADLSGTAQTAPLNLVADISLFAKWKATEHAYGEWVVTTPATCTTTGTRTKTCSVCGEKLTETILALGGTHNYGEWIVTETETIRECAVCHHKEVATYTTGLQFEDVYVKGTMFHMISGIGTAKGAIFIPKTHDGKPVEGIKNSAFEGCSSLTSVTIPEGVTSISDRAFYDCSSLTSVTIPAGVTSIVDEAFRGCSSLTSITIPASVTSIGNMAFDGCSSLTSVTIPAGVTSIGYYAFDGCRSLTSITIPASVTSIENSAFDGSSLTIYAEAASKPWGWVRENNNKNWNSSNCPVVWDSANNIVADNGYIYAVLEGIRYALKDGNATVVGQPSTITTANIPETVNFKNLTYKVTSIGYEAFRYCSSLTSVTIPASVTSIGYEAFRYCSSLTSITIPSGVTSIGREAFYNCSSLTSITIPAGVTSIGREAFYNCSSLTSITIPASVTSIGSEAFTGCISLTIYAEAASEPAGWYRGWNGSCPVVWDSVNNIIADNGNIYAVLEGIRYALKDGNATVVRRSSTITTANIPETVTFNNLTYSVTSIGYEAFKYCSRLTSITIPAGVTSIGWRAFEGCSRLTSITIPEGVTSIGNDAFSNCSSLTSITIPSSVTTIDDYAFFGCSSLTIYAEAASKPADWSSSWNTGCPVVWDSVNNIIASDGNIYAVLEGIRYALKDGNATVVRRSSTITTANIPEAVTFKNLTYKVTSIGEDAFSGCSSLTSITIPASVTSIGNQAFYGCSSLTIYAEAASWPAGWGNSVNSRWNPDNRPVNWGHNNITTNADYDYVIHNNEVYMTKYKGSGLDIIIPALIEGKTVVSFTEIFSDNRTIESVQIPAGVTSIGEGAFRGCSSLTNITVDSGNAKYKSIDGNLYSKDGSTLIQYAIGKTATSFTIPAGVTSIGGYAFYDCSSLTSITIPAGVTSIGSEAFYDCSSLTSITIPAGVTSIGDWAFWFCSSLTSITIPASVTSIGYEAFFGCSSLTIYAEAASKPAGWSSSWNSDWNDRYRPVYWFSATAPTGAPATGTGYWHYVSGVPTKW